MTFVNQLAADNINKKLEFYAAEKLFERGVDAEQIYEQTGCALCPEGQFFYEISDKGFSFTDAFKENDGTPMPLADAVENDTFFEAIPQAENAQIAYLPELKEHIDAEAAYYPQYDLILTSEIDESYVLHEMQHLADDMLDVKPDDTGYQPGDSYADYRNNDWEIRAFETMENEGPDGNNPDILEKTLEEGEPEELYNPSMTMGIAT